MFSMRTPRRKASTPATIRGEKEQWPIGVKVSAFDTLLALLVVDNRNIPARMRPPDFGEAESLRSMGRGQAAGIH